ncbi:anhydro-N-acetylmuramic acid kinase [Agromyces endophyticus]|uniref:anhydro-N-acetylmuramic acid kinase n=1 Tax=Agromyces sp. H17E-10 TaxID=2932244 RepID=UPI001FD3AF6D|nr:anhydro-N-acetylmuramic acid kinase [Agromyces sp. H17E-10]UOQ88096.1 anhydro-N-acetylmuramic acid kinase [Agromyces sp. H17E-10]
MNVLSLQSGTSADGIDVAVVDITPSGSRRRAGAVSRPATRADEIDAGSVETVAALPPRPAQLVMTPLHAETVAWEPTLRAEILAVAAGEPRDARAWTRLTTALGHAFAEAAARGIRESGATPDLIVSHGQTVHHEVEHGHARGTLQLGEPAWIAELTGVPVLSDVRMADIAAGGEGAPLMAFFDRLWLGAEARAAGRSIATVNLGGIANVQLVGADGGVVAFDSGPGNCLIDAVVDRASAAAEGYDRDGRRAAAGRVDESLLSELLRHPYFAAPAPKSTGRETFDLAVVDAALASAGGADPVGLDDLVATLTELTARTVVDAIAPVGATGTPATLICSGGGAFNPVLLARIAELATARDVVVESSAARGIDPAFKESLMFALLGYCSIHGVPTELATGPAGARVLGRLSPGRAPLRLPERLAGAASVTVNRATGHEHRTTEHRTTERRTTEHRTTGGAKQ